MRLIFLLVAVVVSGLTALADPHTDAVSAMQRVASASVQQAKNPNHRRVDAAAWGDVLIDRGLRARTHAGTYAGPPGGSWLGLDEDSSRG